jgi:hypothetical protein
VAADPTTAENQDRRSTKAHEARVRRYAEIAAHLRVARDRPPVETLGRYTVTEAEWSVQCAEAARLLTDEIAAGGHELLLVYADSFEAKRRALTEPNALAVAGSAPSAPRPPAEDAGLPVAAATFQLGERMGSSLPPPPPDARPRVSRTVEMDARALVRATLPFAPVNPADTPAPSLGPGDTSARRAGTGDSRHPTEPAPRPSVEPPPEMDTTVIIDAAALRKAALPFLHARDPERAVSEPSGAR